VLIRTGAVRVTARRRVVVHRFGIVTRNVPFDAVRARLPTWAKPAVNGNEEASSATVSPPTPDPATRPETVSGWPQTTARAPSEIVTPVGSDNVVNVRSRPRATPAALLATTR
jgi:hypothetical protein